jgi:hypothetical protein
MTIEEAMKNIGKSVVYQPKVGPIEAGVITSVNNKFIFVRYGSHKHSQATKPEDLKFEF